MLLSHHRLPWPGAGTWLAVALAELKNLSREVVYEPDLVAARLRGRARALWVFRGFSVGAHVIADTPMYLDVRGSFELGNAVAFTGMTMASSIVVQRGARLSIGDDSTFNYGLSLEVSSQVTIGQRCLFGSLVHISDSERYRSAPVAIGNDVWVAHGAVIEPGVTVGEGSIVAAGSVVTKDVPPHSMAIGNPARIMSLSLRVGERRSDTLTGD
jgi:acetyltransferase-like isoleucine patch superfamily enzyme